MNFCTFLLWILFAFLKKTVLLLLFQTSNVPYTSRTQKQLLCFPVWLVQVLRLSGFLGKECNRSQHCICQAEMQCLLQFMACCCQQLAKDCAQAVKLCRSDGVLEDNAHCSKFAAHVVITYAHFSPGFCIWMEEYFFFPPSSTMASLLTCPSEILASSVVTRHRNCH